MKKIGFDNHYEKNVYKKHTLYYNKPV